MRLHIVGVLFLAGCGTTSTPVDAGHDSGQETPPDMASATDSGAGTFTLRLENYLSWCSVAVNGGAASTVGSQTLTFAPNTVVNLSGDKASNAFVFGYWVGTTGDVGAAHDKSMMTTVTMTGDKLLQACCPFANSPNTPCPAPM